MTAPRSPWTVAIAAHKGGTGKTTTAMALAAALARAGDPVLLIDLDPQGHATMGLGLDVDDDDLRARTVRELLADDPLPLPAVTHPTRVPHLGVVPATIVLEHTAQWLVSAPAGDERLARTLASSTPGRYTWVVIDCPPSLGALTRSALRAADAVLIPCRMEARATDGIRGLLEVLNQLRPAWATDRNWRILRNAKDGRRQISNAFAAEMFAKYQGHVLDTVIPQCDPLNQAQFVGEDIFTYDPRCTGAIAYNRLADDVRALWGNGAPA